MKLGHYHKAERLLKSGYKAISDDRGVDNHATQDAKQNLVRLYKNWGKPEMAKKYDYER
jgi:hypothetical protein